MSTFLELAQDLGTEAGVSGAPDVPIAVTGQIGEAARLCRWIQRAYVDIQNKRFDWDFLREDFVLTLIIGTQSYLPSAIAGYTSHKVWKTDSFRCYLTVTGLVDEQPMEFVEYEIFRDKYLYSANRSVIGRPTFFTVHPRTQAIITFPTADALYTIIGEHFKQPHELAANGDVPLFPSEYHDIVMWRALMMYAAFEGAAETYAHGQAEYLKMCDPLGVDQAPEITTAGPLVS
jgi:hypothetical protein